MTQPPAIVVPGITATAMEDYYPIDTDEMAAPPSSRPVLRRGWMLSVLVTVMTGGPSHASTASAALVAELRRLTQENLDAIAPGDVEVWRRNAHDDLVHVDEAGVVRDKAQFLSELRPLPAGLVGRLAIDTFLVAAHGDTAVVTHEDQEFLDYFGQRIESRWRILDTWIRTPSGWRLVAEQILALQVDPPAIVLRREALCAYNGTYRLNKDVTAKATCGDEGVTFKRTDRPATLYKPEVADVFFAPGQPRTRRIFLRNDKGEITGFVDRREGHDVRWERVE